MSEMEELLKEISGKLDKILRLLVLDAMRGIEREQGKIELLDSLGFRPVEIARLLNKSQENIRVQLSIVREKRKINRNLRNSSQRLEKAKTRSPEGESYA
ncbi:MAG: hypothetical protein QXN20_00700 [Candidatus Bathyarchaeia archaeon]